MTRFPRLVLATLALMAGLALVPARAEDTDSDPAAPRVALEIGEVSVVLIAANGKLHAFVDRLEDNAPARVDRLTITQANGQSVVMNEASAGLFVGPFEIGGRKRDAFLVSLSGPDAVGEASAEIAYGGAPAAAATAEGGLRDKVLIAIVAGLIGLVLGTMLVRRRIVRRTATRPA